jgi:hypothetical protein
MCSSSMWLTFSDIAGNWWRWVVIHLTILSIQWRVHYFVLPTSIGVDMINFSGIWTDDKLCCGNIHVCSYVKLKYIWNGMKLDRIVTSYNRSWPAATDLPRFRTYAYYELNQIHILALTLFHLLIFILFLYSNKSTVAPRLKYSVLTVERSMKWLPYEFKDHVRHCLPYLTSALLKLYTFLWRISIQYDETSRISVPLKVPSNIRFVFFVSLRATFGV